jgi:hypothetical protein
VEVHHFLVREEPPEWKHSVSPLAPVPAPVPEAQHREDGPSAPFLLPDWATSAWPRFGSIQEVALNWLGISRTHASDLACLSADLDKWPRLSGAYDAGLVSRSQAQVVRHVLEPNTEAGWVCLASKTPVRKLKKWVPAYRKIEKQISPEEETETLIVETSPEDIQYVLLTGKEMMEKVVGQSVPQGALVEALLAEWSSGHMERMPPEPEEESPKPERKPETKREEKKEEPMPDLPSGEEAVLEGEAVPCPLRRIPDPKDAKGIDELLDVLLELVGMRQSLDWQAGRALNLCRRFRMSGSALEILGVSPRTAAYLCRVDDDLEIFPALKEAYLAGRLGWAKVSRVLKVCLPETEKAWVERAEELTVIGLEHEVNAMVGFRDFNEIAWMKRTGGLPPDDDLLRELKVLPGRNRAADLDALLRCANVRRASLGEADEPGQSWRPAGRQRLIKTRFQVPSGVVNLWYAVQFALIPELKTVDQGKILRHLVDHFCALGGKHPIHERGDYACGFPGCWLRVCEDEHMKAKSLGGTDDPANRHLLCGMHHRIAKHLGLAKVWGKAPDDIWFQIGRRIWKDNRLVAVVGAA